MAVPFMADNVPNFPVLGPHVEQPRDASGRPHYKYAYCAGALIYDPAPMDGIKELCKLLTWKDLPERRRLQVENTDDDARTWLPNPPGASIPSRRGNVLVSLDRIHDLGEGITVWCNQTDDGPFVGQHVIISKSAILHCEISCSTINALQQFRLHGDGHNEELQLLFEIHCKDGTHLGSTTFQGRFSGTSIDIDAAITRCNLDGRFDYKFYNPNLGNGFPLPKRTLRLDCTRLLV